MPMKSEPQESRPELDLTDKQNQVALVMFLGSLKRNEPQSRQESIMNLAKEKGVQEPERLLALAREMLKKSE